MTIQTTQLLIFSKYPTAGKAKTRTFFPISLASLIRLYNSQVLPAAIAPVITSNIAIRLLNCVTDFITIQLVIE
jgi:hypothetical protein